MRYLRRLPRFAAAAVLAGIMAGCGSAAPSEEASPSPENAAENAASRDSEKETVKEEASSETEERSATVSSDFAPVYAKLAEELYASGGADLFALVDVDGNDVPELVAVDSTNSWEEDEIFVYTIWENEPVLLISEIGPGMEGHEVILFEGENLIENTGAASGDRERYFDIHEGHPRQVLEAYADYILNEETGEIGVFMVNGEDVSEAVYKDTLAGTLSGYKKALVLTCENMLEEDVAWQQDGFFEVSGTAVRPYDSYQEFCRALEGMTPAAQEDCLYYAKVTSPDGHGVFRAGAGTDFGIISDIPDGEILKVYIDNGDWLCVEYDDRTGWIASSQVTRQE